MKRKFLFMIATVLAAAGSAMAVVVLPTGVDEYRIIFVISGGFQATNTDIGWYNTQVSVTAASNTILNGLGEDWYCVGSTASVDARDNISPGIAWDEENIPIYNTAGVKVGDNLADIFDGSLDSAVGFDQNGDDRSNAIVWTGSLQDGTRHGVYPLGDADMVAIGLASVTAPSWINNGALDPEFTVQQPLYGISSPVPEPATVLLFGFGGLALLRKRRT